MIINPLAILLVQIKKLITLHFHAYKEIKCIAVIIGFAFCYSSTSNMPSNFLLIKKMKCDYWKWQMDNPFRNLFIIKEQGSLRENMSIITLLQIKYANIKNTLNIT